MNNHKSAIEARSDAQKIVFGPIAFQLARVLCDAGILDALHSAGAEGMDAGSVAKQAGISGYASTTLLEAGLSFDLVLLENERYRCTTTGSMFVRDSLTRVNMNFVHDICYQGFFHLEDAVRTGTPSGLKTLGDWETIYEGLASMPENLRKSWFSFDHYYSDLAFPVVFPHVFKAKPKKLLDLGGNTGKWALHCVKHDPDVSVTLMDLPGQVGAARERIRQTGYEARIHCEPCDFLDPAAPFPTGFDVIWMSQFLCCFSKPEIVSILTRCREALGPAARVMIQDNYWDRQKHEITGAVLHATSLYFMCMANGNSRMYSSKDLLDCVRLAGLEVEEEVNDLGLGGHTLFSCVAAKG